VKIAEKAQHGVEGYTRRLLKKDVKDARRANAFNFLISNHAALAEVIEFDKE
jgi:hypothetical protein